MNHAQTLSWQRKIDILAAKNNPLFPISALVFLFGVQLVANEINFVAGDYSWLFLLLVVQVYEFAILGSAWVLKNKLKQNRNAALLVILEFFMLGDAALLMDNVSDLGSIGAICSAVWVGLAFGKLLLIQRILGWKLRVPELACATAFLAYLTMTPYPFFFDWISDQQFAGYFVPSLSFFAAFGFCICHPKIVFNTKKLSLYQTMWLVWLALGLVHMFNWVYSLPTGGGVPLYIIAALCSVALFAREPAAVVVCLFFGCIALVSLKDGGATIGLTMMGSTLFAVYLVQRNSYALAASIAALFAAGLSFGVWVEGYAPGSSFTAETAKYLFGALAALAFGVAYWFDRHPVHLVALGAGFIGITKLYRLDLLYEELVSFGTILLGVVAIAAAFAMLGVGVLISLRSKNAENNGPPANSNLPA